MSDPINTDFSPEEKVLVNNDEALDTNPVLPGPDVSDLFAQMRISTNLNTDPGPHATIDVLPDFRYILYQLIDHCTKIFDNIKSRNIPAITPATLLAASLQQIYAYGASLDVYFIRECASYHAVTFADEMQKKQYLNVLTWMKTPDFIRCILTGLTPTCDARRKNICFLYTFAAFSFNHDMGRVFPVHMFLALHNIIAQAGKNASFNDIWRKWLLYRVISEDDETYITVANIIGAAYDNEYTENFLTKKLKTLLSVTTLDYQQRQVVYTQFPFDNVQTQGAFTDINAYDYILGATHNLTPTMMQFTAIMSGLFASLFARCEPLGAMFAIPSGMHIMNHFYDEPLTPTFHNLPVVLDLKKTKQASLTNYEDRLRYKCTYKCQAKPTVKIIQPNENIDITDEINLVTDDTTVTPNPDTKIGTYSRSKRGDNIILYSPWSTGESSMYYAITSGIHIESFEIDSFHVPYPNVNISIHDENSQFLQSAIPINSTVDYRDYDGNTLLYVRQRQTDDDDFHRISHSYYDYGKHQLPVYYDRITTTLTSNLLPGFTMTKGITHPNLAATKFTIPLHETWPSLKCDVTLPTSIFAWSSYRWIDPMHAHEANFLDSTYIICDFRPLYGTIPETHMTRHLFNLIN